MKPASLALALALALAGCRRPPLEPVVVEVRGALHEVMHEGRLEAVAAVAPPRGSRTYGLGALSGLRGEITILDDDVVVSLPGGGAPRTIRGAAGEQACLLVTARVPRWKRVTLEADVPYERLDASIREIARQHGVDVEKPFPFLVEGRLEALEWHVIDGARLPPGGGGGHAAHIQASDRGVFDAVQGTLVGFFSTSHRGVFTHHDADTHLHVVVGEPLLSAHVDAVRLPKGAILALPEVPPS